MITLTAFDIDSEDLTYSIMDGSQGFFKINSTTGEVGLAKSLDREEVDDFLLTVFVSDGLFNVCDIMVLIYYVFNPYFDFIRTQLISEWLSLMSTIMHLNL